MDVKEWVITNLPEGLIVFISALLAWLGKRVVKRLDTDIEGHGLTLAKHAERFAQLETKRVTTDDIDELRGSMNATVTNAFEMLDRNIERRHAENIADRQHLLQGVTHQVESVRSDVRELWKVKHGG